MRKPALKRVVLCNVKYSPNLGDGLLSECLERALMDALPGCEVVSIDLAGRTDYPEHHKNTRGIALSALERCPPILRNFATRSALEILSRIRYLPHYKKGFSGADALILGGGNLLSDADLNFPIKIAGALKQAHKMGLPIAIHAIGVSADWSRTGTALFTRAIAQSHLISASVRDSFSQTTWDSQLSQLNGPSPIQVVDPGVLASQYYPATPSPSQKRKVGFCVTAPLAVRYHSHEGHAADLDTWYPNALRSLVLQGFEISLFTNGSPEDRAYLHANFEQWIRFAKGPVYLGSSFKTPSNLAQFVSSCTAVVAHRMHACIAAYSYGVPALGLQWDIKLNSFFALAGRSSHICDPATQDASALGSRVSAAITDTFDPAPLIARARDEITMLASLLQEQCT